MPEQSETHKGFKIVIDDDQDKLTIDDRQIDVSKAESGRYITSYMPYTEYESIMDLAKQVIEKAADFDTISGD